MPSGIYTLRQQNQNALDGSLQNQKPVNVNYLVIAGGGGGASTTANTAGGGAGGAGGLLEGQELVTPGTSITVTVGGGGSAGAAGQNSEFGSVVATGGGFGRAAQAGAAGSGGSGGGTSQQNIQDNTLLGTGIVGQGNDGGAGNYACGGGGGGGAGGLVSKPFLAYSLNAGSRVGGDGGQGVASDISGVRTTYAGGGGGGTYPISGILYRVGQGGAGGGANGGAGANGSSGTANTGGGGGGGGNSDPSGYTGGSGGSGIVIISYPDTYQAAASTTGSPTIGSSGSGSLSFDGSGDYLRYADNALFRPGTGDFTIEAFVYHSVDNTTQAYFVGPTNGLTFQRNSSNKLELAQSGVSTILTSINNIPGSQWVHVAASRSSGTVKLFIDGVEEASLINGTNFAGSGSYDVGGSGASSTMNGFITNLRLVLGSGLYTSAFTVPTSPISAPSGTSLLLSAVSGSVYADFSGNGLTATVNGSTVWNSGSPFASGQGYQNRVYKWTASGSITF